MVEDMNVNEERNVQNVVGEMRFETNSSVDTNREE